MPDRRTILYTLAWVAYIVFSWILFPRWNTNVMIPMIALLAVGGWIYGRTKGLVLIIPATVYHYLLLSEIYADIALYYQSRLLGSLLAILAVLLTGTLKKYLTGIKETNEKLDRAVAQRNQELAAQTRKLTEQAETIRINHGQELHDGIGQQLTGIQLYCTSLAEQLGAERNASASLAHSLSHRAGLTHNLVRRAARSLFPVQIAKIGLLPALDELVAFLREMKDIEITLESHGNVESLTPTTAHQLYRICQEYALHALKHAHARRIDIKLIRADSMLRLAIGHDGIPMEDQTTPSTESRLIKYRMKQLQGTLKPEKVPPYSEYLNIVTPIHKETTTA